MMSQKPYAPSAERNRHAILEALRPELSAGDHVLEIGSGTAQHVCHFAPELPDVRWQPSDCADKLPGMLEWIHESNCSNIMAPIELDLRKPVPELKDVTLCYSANTLHIVSWPLVEKLFLLAAGALRESGKLCIYGPFIFEGQHISEGNRQFDRQLRAADAASGLRDTRDLNQLAQRQGFSCARVTALPANNHLLVWDC